ncbi:MAG: diguanylate cyclase (GGDEF)-like protein [Candidatus Omnitrophota bacterium]|jgi:diguanylate cyclase (GGDEF)-like protein
MELKIGFLIIGYLFVFHMFMRKIVRKLYCESDEKIEKIKQKENKMSAQKEELVKEKNDCEIESKEIFTLYEITKEITKSTNEKEAFKVFRSSLEEFVNFKECDLLDPLSTDIKELRKNKDAYIFTLQGKRRKIGYILVLGLSDEDKEKFMILAHQFALALRRVKLYEEIEKTAITDSLTELHTRGHTLNRFDEELARAKARDIETSFLMIDVDHFKNLNDQYGHLTGDKILRKIARIVMKSIREIDIGGRYGGEEFCVVLPDTDSEGAFYAAERIRKAAEETEIRAYDATVNVTVSIGISTYPKDGKDASEIIDKADWALYRSKKLGRNKTSLFGIYKE